jgi:hypothetical protein
MRFGWASLLAAAAHAAPARAQWVTELGLQAVMTTSTPVLVGGGLYAAARTSQRLRVALSLAGGVADDEAAGRGELAGHFLLNPAARNGIGAYAGGGVAGVVGPRDTGYLLLLLGVEARPGAAAGWALELGVGSGLRIAGGYRWRRLVP